MQRMTPVGRVQAEPSLTRSALWLVTAKCAAFVLNLAVPLLLVRQLTVRDFGVYKQLFLLLDTATAIMTLGFAMSAFYFFPREPARKTQVVGNILVFYALVGGLAGAVFAIFPALPAVLLNSRDLAEYAPAIDLAVLLWVGASALEFLAIANGEAWLAARIIPLTALLRSALLVAAGMLFGSVRALAYAAALYGILQSGVTLWYVRSRFSGAGRQIDWPLMRAQFAYTLPLAYANMLLWLQLYVHHYFVSNRYGAAAYAIYAVGCFQLPIVGFALESFGSVLIRRVSELRRQNETREIIRIVAHSVRTLAVLLLPVYSLLLVTGRDVITILFTERYSASWPIFAVNLTLIPLGIVAPAYDAVFRACPEHLSVLYTTRTALLVPLLGGLWIATHRFGLVAPIVVVVGVTLAERVAIVLRVTRILDMAWSDLGLFRDVAKLGAAAGVAGVVTAVARRALPASGLGDKPLALLVVSAGVFGAAYLGTVLLLRVLTPEEWGAIRQRLIRVSRTLPWRSGPDAPEQAAREQLV